MPAGILQHLALYRVEDDLVHSEHAVTTDLIALYKALGGGWEDIKLTEAK